MHISFKMVIYASLSFRIRILPRRRLPPLPPRRIIRWRTGRTESTPKTDSKTSALSKIFAKTSSRRRSPPKPKEILSDSSVSDASFDLRVVGMFTFTWGDAWRLSSHVVGPRGDIHIGLGFMRGGFRVVSRAHGGDIRNRVGIRLLSWY